MFINQFTFTLSIPNDAIFYILCIFDTVYERNDCAVSRNTAVAVTPICQLFALLIDICLNRRTSG